MTQQSTSENTEVCKISSCSESHYMTRGMCSLHYSRWMNGDRGDRLRRPRYHNGPRGDYVNEDLAAEKSPTVEDVAWAAGIFEGEGWCGTRSGNRSTRVSVTNNDRGTLEKMKRFFGGVIKERSEKADEWKIMGPRASGFLMTIYPIVASNRRQEQIKEAL